MERKWRLRERCVGDGEKEGVGIWSGKGRGKRSRERGDEKRVTKRWERGKMSWK
jgi:hypothetical protein